MLAERLFQQLAAFGDLNGLTQTFGQGFNTQLVALGVGKIIKIHLHGILNLVTFLDSLQTGM